MTKDAFIKEIIMMAMVLLFAHFILVIYNIYLFFDSVRIIYLGLQFGLCVSAFYLSGYLLKNWDTLSKEEHETIL